MPTIGRNMECSLSIGVGKDVWIFSHLKVDFPEALEAERSTEVQWTPMEDVGAPTITFIFMWLSPSLQTIVEHRW
jgi:hypothetical protein